MQRIISLHDSCFNQLFLLSGVCKKSGFIYFELSGPIGLYPSIHRLIKSPRSHSTSKYWSHDFLTQEKAASCRQPFSVAIAAMPPNLVAMGRAFRKGYREWLQMLRQLRSRKQMRGSGWMPLLHASWRGGREVWIPMLCKETSPYPLPKLRETAYCRLLATTRSTKQILSWTIGRITRVREFPCTQYREPINCERNTNIQKTLAGVESFSVWVRFISWWDETV